MAMSELWDMLGEEVSLKKGMILALPGTIPACCYYIQSGTVLAYSENDHGLKSTYGVFRSGNLILEQDLMRKKESVLGYETSQKVQARKISKVQLEEALRREPMLYQDLLYALMQFEDSVLEQTLNKQEGNAASRLSTLLLNLAKDYGVEESGTIIICHKVSQEKMAQLAGLHRITVVREMKKMQEQSLVIKQIPWYVIPNVTKLTEYRDQQRMVS
ncbi:MAG: Crp/Fnr family transcriptional regulator [Brotaphodocola sp.]